MFDDILEGIKCSALKDIIEQAFTLIHHKNSEFPVIMNAELIQAMTKNSASVFLKLKEKNHTSKEHLIYEQLVSELSKVKIETQGHTLFPNNQSRTFIGYLGEVTFTDCKFKDISEIDTQKIYTGFGSKERSLFNRCDFYHRVRVKVYSPKTISEKSLNTGNPAINDYFYECTFYKSVIVEKSILSLGSTNEVPELHAIFHECTFSSYLKLKSLNIFCNVALFTRDKQFIPSIIIDSCSLQRSLKLNASKNFKPQYKSILLKDSIFRGKFELKGVECDIFMQKNCNFEKVCDFHGSIFKKIFLAKKSIYRDFFAFENVKCLPNVSKTVFQYVTFKTQSSFRDSKFFSGLDISRANFIEAPNFLNATVPSVEKTPRETYRIIKHSFDNVGNHLEANRFFALEMERNKYELKNRITESSSLSKNDLKQIKSDLTIFRFNQFFSDFGQSWKKPFRLILALAVISQFFYCGLEDVGISNSTAVTVFCDFSEVTKEFLCNQYAGWFVIWILISSVWAWFYGRIPIILVGSLFLLVLLKIIGISFPISTFLGPLIALLNRTVEQIPPFNKFLVEGHEFISFVINILFAVLIWQLIVAVKRLTRR